MRHSTSHRALSTANASPPLVHVPAPRGERNHERLESRRGPGLEDKDTLPARRANITRRSPVLIALVERACNRRGPRRGGVAWRLSAAAIAVNECVGGRDRSAHSRSAKVVANRRVRDRRFDSRNARAGSIASPCDWDKMGTACAEDFWQRRADACHADVIGCGVSVLPDSSFATAQFASPLRVATIASSSRLAAPTLSNIRVR